MTRREFTTKVREDLIEEIRTIAKAEDREVDAAVEEALRAYVARRQAKPRAHVMAHFHDSLERYAPLYRRLAEIERAEAEQENRN